jgi:hypothetical protein
MIRRITKIVTSSILWTLCLLLLLVGAYGVKTYRTGIELQKQNKLQAMAVGSPLHYLNLWAWRGNATLRVYSYSWIAPPRKPDEGFFYKVETIPLWRQTWYIYPVTKENLVIDSRPLLVQSFHTQRGDKHSRMVQIQTHGYWPAVLMVPFLIMAGMTSLRVHRRVRRKRYNQCVTCGYDLRATDSGKCPECGTGYANPSI